jgi:hypothetical protein
MPPSRNKLASRAPSAAGLLGPSAEAARSACAASAATASVGPMRRPSRSATAPEAIRHNTEHTPHHQPARSMENIAMARQVPAGCGPACHMGSGSCPAHRRPASAHLARPPRPPRRHSRPPPLSPPRPGAPAEPAGRQVLRQQRRRPPAPAPAATPAGRPARPARAARGRRRLWDRCAATAESADPAASERQIRHTLTGRCSNHTGFRKCTAPATGRSGRQARFSGPFGAAVGLRARTCLSCSLCSPATAHSLGCVATSRE